MLLKLFNRGKAHIQRLGHCGLSDVSVTPGIKKSRLFYVAVSSYNPYPVSTIFIYFLH